MASGIEKTFQLFAKTENHAAVPVLIDALDSPYAELREAALSALLRQRHLVAQRALVQRWRKFTAVQRSWIELSGISLEIALKELLQSTEPDEFALAVDILTHCPEFELIPLLVLIAQDAQHNFRDKAGTTLVQLASRLRREMKAPTRPCRRGIETTRSYVLDSLSDGIRQFEQHQSLAVLEAFLVLVTRENQLLREAWSSPQHPAHSAIIRFLRHSSRPEIIDLVIGSLTETHPSLAVLNVIGLRHDPAFLSELTNRMQGNLGDEVRRNLAKLTRVAWAEDHAKVLEKLSNLQQAAAVHLAVATSVGAERLYDLLVMMATRGHTNGRLAALEELAQFVDPQTNAIILDALNDRNASVRAEALRQLRARGIPGAIKLLLQHLDSPQLVVQDAVRTALAEFNFPRYLAAFDRMSPEARRNNGRLVRGIDVHTQRLLAEELQSDASSRRERALKIIDVMENHLDMEGTLIAAVQHPDHFLRAEAAILLGRCHSSDAVAALREAMLDRNVRVRENAEASLRRIAGTRQTAPPLEIPTSDPTGIQAGS